MNYIKQLKTILLGSAVFFSWSANAQITEASSSSSNIIKIIQQKVDCEQIHKLNNVDCSEVDAEFERIKHLTNVETMYEMYKLEKVQMEMYFGNHPGQG